VPDTQDIHGYAFGAFRVDVPSYQLRHDDAALPLTPKAFDTLLVLLRHRDRIVGKDELMSAVWPDLFVSEDSLTQSISVLRRTLGDDPNAPKYIATVARIGYRFIAPVEVIVTPERTQPAAEPRSGAKAASAAVATTAPAASPPSPSRLRWMAVAMAAAAVVIAAVVARRALTASAPPPRGPLRFTQESPEGTALRSGGILSPDGRYLAFVAADTRTGHRQVWVRALDAAVARVVPGTEDAERPFWSADGTALAFFASGRLKRVALDGAPAHVVATTGPANFGGSWNRSGLLLFATVRGAVLAVPASGGTPTPVTTLDAAAHEVAHRWPQFLPDGRHFLYYVDSVDPAASGTFLGSLDDKTKTRVVDAPAFYAASGHLLFIRDRVLMAQTFDPGRGLSGTPVTLAGHVLAPETTNEATISASSDGLLAFSVSKGVKQLQWFDRQGQAQATIASPVDLRNPMLSRDGRRLVAASRSHDERRGIWTIDVERGAISRVTADGMRPLLSPSGDRIAFTSDRAAGVADIYIRPVGGRETEDTLVLKSPDNKFVSDWSPDGQFLVYGTTDRRANTDLWMMPIHQPQAATPLVRTPANEVEAQVSPDGHWLAYASDESGSWEVYVQPFPDPGQTTLVSVGGGVEPHWRRDGHELFYLSTDGRLMAVDVKPGASFSAAAPHALFRAPVSGVNVYINQFTPAPDGQRFLIDAGSRTLPVDPITIMVNWTALVHP
jgi:Tol biopolymer transport system component/DNA-binding winged helix-turn-helix (wHTH) protein